MNGDNDMDGRMQMNENAMLSVAADAESKNTDSPEQAAVIQAPSYEDAIVVAGAGSGKTYTMTRRIVTLIRHEGISPEKILGLTFTRKAASELLSRVSAAVTGKRGARDGQGGRTIGRDCFLKPEVSTYDAFFQSIVRQYGLLVGFDQNTQPLSEAGAMQLIDTVLDRHMNQLMAFNDGDGERSAFRTIASDVYTLSNAIAGAMIGGDCSSFDEAVERVRAWDEAFVAQVAKALEDDDVPGNKPKPKLKKRTKKESDADFEARRREYRAQCHQLCVYNTVRLADVARKRNLLLDLVADYNAEKRALNMAEFSDFTIAAFQLVTRFPSIGATYRKRYTHVLLDEYQDTSTTQAALLTALFHVDDTRRSAVNAVGDPFQSIYAWRGASPGAFRMLQHDFGHDATDKPYALTVTRRNSRMVLEAANNLTKPLRLPSRRASSSLMREVDVPALVNIETAPEGTLGVLGYATLGQEIDAVIRFVKHAIALHTPSESEIANGKKDERPHVAVLFRSKAQMPVYEDALKNAGLTTLVVGQAALLERPEIKDILALLHVVCDHTDSASLMRLIATPRFGVGADDLQALAGIAERLNIRQRYRALVSAGIVEKEADPSDEDVRATVRTYRDQIPNAVFLIDVLLRGDLQKLVEGELSAAGAAGVEHAGRVIQQVQRTVGHPLPEVVRSAITALDLDIDLLLAERMRQSGDGQNQADRNTALATSPLDAMLSLVDTYMQEIASQGTPSLRAFISWVDSSRDASDDNATSPDIPVDVKLMTVHQSKGLEWDAVAVVGMRDGTFPSNQGDHLNVTMDESHQGGMKDGVWEPPEYSEKARTWLEEPSAVPVPVRADAAILPRFPHDALVGGNPLEALAGLDDAETIDDEAFGTLRTMPIDDMEGVDPAGLYLTQQEEYGRRLHADERRLAYVALTRARYDVLLTYSGCNETSRDSRLVEEEKGATPSNFWREVRDSMKNIVSVVREPGNLADSPVIADALGHADVAESDDSLHTLGCKLPEGYFVGEHARDFEDAVVGNAWNAPLEPVSDDRHLPWPCGLTSDAAGKLRAAADEVRAAGHVAAGKRQGNTTQAPQSQSGNTLLDCAKRLVADENLMPETGTFGKRGNTDESKKAFDAAVRAKGERILAAGRQNVTSLQARAGSMSEYDARTYWRGLVRPIPHVASPAAQLGTQFHAWAERFIMAEADAGGIGGEDGLDSTSTQSRAEMIAAIGSARTRQDGASRSQDERKITEWQQRLAESKWSERRPAWVERQLVVNVPQLGTIVNGKLDAVFFGGLDESDRTKRYTVVDWKTGRKPHKDEEINEKLAQLDMYRLLLAAMEGVPLGSIDACLYYVSEPHEADRELDALDKTEEEILAELSYGIPQQSDND